MRFRHSVLITADQFPNVFKLLLYRIVSGIVFFSLTFVILRLGLAAIVQSAEFDAVKGLLGDFLRALTTGEVEELHNFQTVSHNVLVAFGQLVASKIGSIVGSVIGVSCIYLLSRFTNGLALFAVGTLINERMSVFARVSFQYSFFRNIGNAALYQVIYVPLAFVYDLISMLACWLFFFYVPSLLPSWGVVTVLIAVSLTLTAIICLQALKLTFISSWIPAIIEGKKSVVGALKETAQNGKRFSHRFAGFLVAIYLVVVVNVAFALCTVGSGLLLTVPLSFIFLLVMQFVNYYEGAGKKYFIEKDRIVGGVSSDDPSAMDS